MNFQFPSFFRIRLSALVISSIAAYLLVGTVNNVFAGWPGDCTYVATDCTVSECSPHQVGYNGGTSYDGYSYNSETGIFTLGDIVQIEPYHNTNEGPACALRTFYYENDRWNSHDFFGFYTKTFLNCPVPTGHPHISSLPPEGCADCTQQRAALAQQCGGDDNIINWDEWACTGECKGKNLGPPTCSITLK